MPSMYDSLAPDPLDDAFGETGRFDFDFPITDEVKQWWRERIYQPYGLTPSKLVDILLEGLDRNETLLFYRMGYLYNQHIISLSVQGEDGEKIIYLSGETIYLNNPLNEDGLGHHVEVDLMDVVPSHQGQGISAALMHNIYKLAIVLGIHKMSVEAYLDGGPYAWLSYGFVPLQNHWADIKKKIRDKLDELGAQVSQAARDRIEPVIDHDDPTALVTLLDEHEIVSSYTRERDGTRGSSHRTTLSKALMADSGQRWYAILDLDDDESKLLFEDCVRRNQR